MNYLSRQLVNARLKISLQQSYRIVGKGQYGARISSDHAIEILNRARRGDTPVLTCLPDDLLTADELAAELSESGITAHDLAVWTHRTLNPVPHYYINRYTVRFRKVDVERWLDARTIKRRRCA